MNKQYKWSIDKSFAWEGGHRVWAQKLDRPHLSIDTSCKCKHLHGHSYEIKVVVSADDLNDAGMVMDFKELSFMKEFLDDVLDHKFMIDVNDPLFCRVTGVDEACRSALSFQPNFTNIGTFLRSTVNEDRIPNLRGDDELYDSFVVVNFIPTSENICRYLKEYAQEKIGSVATVTALELWETKKSHCKYIG